MMKRLILTLATIAVLSIPSYAVSMFGKTFEFPVQWGADLQSEHERY